jgi:hypothetical protein
VLVCHSPDSDDRKAELLRKGMMFEWLERKFTGKDNYWDMILTLARNWWRGRSKKR